MELGQIGFTRLVPPVVEKLQTLTHSWTMRMIPNSYFILLTALALGSTTLHASSKYGRSVDNRIMAQELVNKIMAECPSLVAVGLHCVPPGGDRQVIIASTLNVIGKFSDPEDVLHGSTKISPSQKGPKLGIMLPLHDRTGKEIGSLALQFKYPAGADQLKCFAAATEIREHVALEIPSLPDLFAAAP